MEKKSPWETIINYSEQKLTEDSEDYNPYSPSSPSKDSVNSTNIMSPNKNTDSKDSTNSTNVLSPNICLFSDKTLAKSQITEKEKEKEKEKTMICYINITPKCNKAILKETKETMEKKIEKMIYMIPLIKTCSNHIETINKYKLNDITEIIIAKILFYMPLDDIKIKNQIEWMEKSNTTMGIDEYIIYDCIKKYITKDKQLDEILYD
jgi:hypothetical protein